MDGRSMEGVLLQMTQPNTEAVQQATSHLQAMMKDPSCVGLFLGQIQNSGETVARQLAAILLRKKVATYWPSQDAQLKQHTKEFLLKRMVEEPQRVVQQAIAGVVAEIAKIEIPAETWNELLTFLLQCTQEGEARLRELAMLLFRALSESIGSYLQSHFETLFQIYKSGMQDPESLLVREESFRAIGMLYLHCDDIGGLERFHELVPAMLGVLDASAASANDVAVSNGFAVLEDMAESPVPILDAHIPNIVSLVAKLQADPNCDMSIRERACSLMVWIIKQQGRKLRPDLVEYCVSLAFSLLVQECDEEDESGDRSSVYADPVQTLGLEILDEVCLNVLTDAVFESAMRNALALTKDGNNRNRASGYLALYMMAEGCAEHMAVQAAPLLQLVCAALSDPDRHVRINASGALSQFGEHFSEAVLEHHELVLSSLCSSLEHAEERVGRRLIGTLETVCAALEGNILDMYLEKLAVVFDRQLGVLEGACGALGALAQSAGPAFQQFFPAFANKILHLMAATGEAHVEMRASATRCLGLMGKAVGGDLFRQVCLSKAVELAIEGLKMDKCELREAAFILFGYMAETNPTEFQQVVPMVQSVLIYALESTEGVKANKRARAADSDFGNVNIGDEDEEEEEADASEFTPQIDVHYSIASGFVDEKVAALSCISLWFKFLAPEAVGPLLEKTLEVLEVLTEHISDTVRIMAMTVYDDVFAFIHRCWGSSSPQTKQAMEQVIPILITSIGVEYDKQAASIAADVLGRIMKLFSADIMVEYLPMVLHTEETVFRNQSTAQLLAPDMPPETEDLDELIESATELASCITQMTAVDAKMQLECLRKLLPVMIEEPPTTGDLCTVIGGIGEMAVHMRPEVAMEIRDAVWPFVLQMIQHPASIVRRSAAFCCGTLLQKLGPEAAPLYAAALELLQALFHLPEGCSDAQAVAARDNACSALGRILISNPSGKGMEQQLGAVIDQFIRGLPLIEDKQEGDVAYPLLAELMSKYGDEMKTRYTPHLVFIVGQVVNDSNVSQEPREKLAAAFRQFVAVSDRAALQQSIAQLQDPQAQQVVASFL